MNILDLIPGKILQARNFTFLYKHDLDTIFLYKHDLDTIFLYKHVLDTIFLYKHDLDTIFLATKRLATSRSYKVYIHHIYALHGLH